MIFLIENLSVLSFLEWIFWIALLVVFYTYLGYGIVLYILVRIKTIFFKDERIYSDFEPEVTLMIAAYNEGKFIKNKILNILELDYPKDKLDVIFVTDGSDDDTVSIIKKYNSFTLLHREERNGKVSAINRAIRYVKTPIVIFCDANTLLNKDSIKKISRHYADKKIGGVSGEKRILKEQQRGASGSGEGFYWKYESFLKKLDSKFYSIVGAAGELFSIRTELYEELEADTILDDFMISLKINMKGYRIHYEPEAYAQEAPSASIEEESKRKVRICAGGFQSMGRLMGLFNIFNNPKLSFQYISHRVLRWAIAPFALPAIFVTSFLLSTEAQFFKIVFIAQLLFYLMAAVGGYLSKKNIKIKLLFIPYYFSFMNWSVYLGLIKFIKKEQSAVWEKAQRSTIA